MTFESACEEYTGIYHETSAAEYCVVLETENAVLSIVWIREEM